MNNSTVLKFFAGTASFFCNQFLSGQNEKPNIVIIYADDQPCTFDFQKWSAQKPELLLGDFKRFTNKSIVQAIIDNPKESRKEFLLEQFIKAGNKSSNVNKY